MTTDTQTIFTAEEFQNAPRGVGACELVEGELVIRKPAGVMHAMVQDNIQVALSNFVRRQEFGRTFGSTVGYVLSRDPDTVRLPDASFVSRERIAVPLPSGFFIGAPDVAIEILSPTKTAAAMQQKTAEYIAAGSSAVWLIDPTQRSVIVVSHGVPLKVLGQTDMLTNGDVLNGFVMPVAALFAI